MKKLLTISILAIVILLMSISGVNATTNATLPEEAYAKLTKYGMTKSDQVKVERFLATNPVSDADADKLMELANKAAKVMDKAGTVNYLKLNEKQKNEVKDLANQAAEIVNLKLAFVDNQVKIYKGTKLLDVVTFSNGKLVYTGSKDLAEIAYEKFAKFGMTKSDKVKVERYLASYPVSDSDADKLVEKADAAVKIMNDAGKTNYAELTEKQKNAIKKVANEAADILNLTLAFEKNEVKIYKNGKLLDVVTFKNGKLVYTGNNNIVLVVSSVVAVALVSAFIARKKYANA